MFDHVDILVAHAEAHYQQLLEEARIERLLKAGMSHRTESRATVRGLLLGFSNLLFKLGQLIRTACGASPLPLPDDEAPKFQVQ